MNDSKYMEFGCFLCDSQVSLDSFIEHIKIGCYGTEWDCKFFFLKNDEMQSAFAEQEVLHLAIHTLRYIVQCHQSVPILHLHP